MDDSRTATATGTGPTPLAQTVFWELAAAIWRSRARAGLTLALLVASKLAFVGVPMVLKRIVDHYSAVQTVAMLPAFLLLGYALLRLLGGVFTELRDIAFSPVTERIVSEYTLRAFAHLHRLGARFHVRRQTGGVVRDVERGTAGIGYLVGIGLMTILPTLVEIASVLAIVAAAYSGSFIAIILATVAAYSVVTRLLTERRSRLQRRRLELDATTNARIVDSLLNYETVKAFANEDFESRRLQEVLTRRQQLALRVQGALSRLHVSQSAVIALGVGAVMLLAGQRVSAGLLTVGDLVLINSYIIQVCLPLNSLGFVFRQSKDALLDVERLFALLRQQPDIIERADTPELRVSAAAVKFENISFGYGDRQVLWNVDFAIPPGGTVAVVGGSGSGKSTLARLLLRLYDPQQGRILIDGQDIRLVSQHSLRRYVGLVPQDTALFNDSLAYNIAYGATLDASVDARGAAPNATAMSRVMQAAQAAHIHGFIAALPEQYDTAVGERGVKLSGGERQRIAIARAILRNPPILIFDEATSALDTRSERLIQDELERISRDRTTLIIAHRLSTVVEADLIVVLERGRIVEQGRHAELLEAGGLYAQMWALQQAQGEIERTEQRIAAQPIHLVALLGAVVEGLRSRLESCGVSLYTSLSDEASRITGDPGALQQLFSELSAWMVEASSRGGRIELQMERIGPDSRITLSGHRSTAATGVHAPDPLSLNSVVEANGGRLSHQLPATGNMEFVMEFPLRAVAAEPIAPAIAEAVSIAGLRIMSIDDQPDALQAMSGLLVSYGAQVEALSSGHEALSRLRARDRSEWPDLLICDIALGEESGYDVLRELRAMEDARDLSLEQRLPAIALTGFHGAEHRTRALMAGFQMHLSKPVAADELLAAVGTLARRVA